MPLDQLQIKLQQANAALYNAQADVTRAMHDPNSSQQDIDDVVAVLMDAEQAVRAARVAWEDRRVFK